MVQRNPKFIYLDKTAAVPPSIAPPTIVSSCSGAFSFFLLRVAQDWTVSMGARGLPSEYQGNNVRQLLGPDCQGSWEPGCATWRSTEDFSLVLYRAANKDRGMQSSITKGEKL